MRVFSRVPKINFMAQRKVALGLSILLSLIAIGLIIGRGLTAKAHEALGLSTSTLFRLPENPTDTKKGFSLGQKMVGKACGLPVINGSQQGVRPGTYCEPRMTSVGSSAPRLGSISRRENVDSTAGAPSERARRRASQAAPMS